MTISVRYVIIDSPSQMSSETSHVVFHRLILTLSLSTFHLPQLTRSMALPFIAHSCRNKNNPRIIQIKCYHILCLNCSNTHSCFSMLFCPGGFTMKFSGRWNTFGNYHFCLFTGFPGISKNMLQPVFGLSFSTFRICCHL